jgi:putative tricarboxylic transport membrane protein
MLEIVIAILVGTAFGIMGGLLPSISNSVVLLTLFFILTKIDITVLVCFYISLLVASQYTGSVAATLLGTLGESSSVPALKEGRALYHRGQAKWALTVSAWGSMIGSLLAVSAAVILLPWAEDLFVMTYTEVRVAFFVLLIAMLILSSNNRWYVNIMMIAAGLVLGFMGWNEHTNQTWGTFGIPQLASGMPIMLVLVCFYGLPLMFGQSLCRSVDSAVAQRPLPKRWWRRFPVASTARGSVIGFFTGLIPNLTYEAASNFAWAVERWKNRHGYSPGNVQSLAAAETANNAAVLTSLVPFVIFMIPVQLSEVIMLDIIRSTGQPFDLSWLWQPGVAVSLLMAFAVANVLALIVAWPGGQHLVHLITDHERSVLILAAVIMLAGVTMQAYQLNDLPYWITMGVILFFVGWRMRNLDVVPFVIAFVLAKPMILVFVTWWQKILFIY